MSEFVDLPPLPDNVEPDADPLPLPDLDVAQNAGTAILASQAVEDGDAGSATEPEDAPPVKKVKRKPSEAAQTRLEYITPHGFSIMAALPKLRRPGTELLAALNANAEAAEALAARIDGLDGSAPAGSAPAVQTDDADVRKAVEELDTRMNALAVQVRDAARAPQPLPLAEEFVSVRATVNTDHSYLARLGETVVSALRTVQQQQSKTAELEKEVAALKTKILLLSAVGSGLPELPATSADVGALNRTTRPRSPSLADPQSAANKRARVETSPPEPGSSRVCPAILFGPWRGIMGKTLHEVWTMVIDTINSLPDHRNIALPYAVVIDETNTSYVSAVFKTLTQRDAVLTEWRTAPNEPGRYRAASDPCMVQTPPEENCVNALQSTTYSRGYRRR